MKTVRDMMRENNDNLDWCRPESYLDGRVILAISEGGGSRDQHRRSGRGHHPRRHPPRRQDGQR